MNSKNRNIITGLIILLFSSCLSQQPVYKCYWQDKDFTSLSNKELMESFRFYDRKSKLQYSITNDNKNMYICVIATDEQSQMKIIHAGMQVNIDTTGKGKQQTGILFPMAGTGKPGMYTGMKQGQEKNNKNNPEKKAFRLEQREMELYGFKPRMNGIVPLTNDYGISVNIDWDSLNIMYYKAIIPFNTFYKETLTPQDSMKIFSLSVTVNAIEMPGNGSMGAPPGRGERPEGGNMQGGEMPGGGMMGNNGPPPGGGMQTDNSFSEKNIIKVKIKMAVKQE